MRARRFGMTPGRRAALASAILAGGLATVALATVALAAPAPTAKPMSPTAAKANSHQPIDITADRLDVDQNSQLATFSGNVHAVQADVTLRTQTLKVYYERKAKKDSARKADGAPSQSTIQRLEATGGVVIQAPGETARGQRGTYDVVNRVARLSGDVVLTRGQNVVRGDRLTMDFGSGQSRMEGPAGGKGRVHGVFLPQNSGNGDDAQGGGR
jgi:lipopolysaccharide export system protein LptA